jgi:hypothetical protein
MARRAATRGPDKTGHADTPRQDSQRPVHADHADAGGQESTSRRTARTQQAAGTRPDEAPPVPGQRQADPPLPRVGRQPERPGQDARAKDVIGSREGLADAEGEVETRKPQLRRR